MKLTIHSAQNFVTDGFPDAGTTIHAKPCLAPKTIKIVLMKIGPIEFSIYSVFIEILDNLHSN
jgi:hypothetical protein